MRYLITFLCIYCLVAVLAEIPDSLRRVKRHEVTQHHMNDTQLKEFTQIQAGEDKGAQKAVVADAQIDEKREHLEALKGKTIDSNANDKDNSDTLTAKLALPVGHLWREHGSHKRKHLNEKSGEKVSTEAPASLFAHKTLFPHGMATESRGTDTDLSSTQKTRLRHFRQGPYSYKNRNFANRLTRNKKKPYGGKRKTVLVLHAPHAAKYIAKESPRHLSDELLKEELQQLELDAENDFMEPLSIFKTHEPKKTVQHLSYFADVPTFPWELTNVDSQYPVKSKHLIDPVDKLMKFANMMMYKVGGDGVPFHTQATRITATPEMVISATATGNTHDAGDFNELEHNFFSENVHAEGGHKSTHDKSAENDPTATYGTLEFMPPIQIGAHAKEPKKLISLIENALDTVLLSNDEQKDEGDEEIEVHCPIHNAGAGGLAKQTDEPAEEERIGGSVLQPKPNVMEVCQCHFIKKKKETKH